MTLIVRKTRHKLSYKNRRFGLTSLEKMTIKSVGEYIETAGNILSVNASIVSSILCFLSFLCFRLRA